MFPRVETGLHPTPPRHGRLKAGSIEGRAGGRASWVRAQAWILALTVFSACSDAPTAPQLDGTDPMGEVASPSTAQVHTARVGPTGSVFINLPADAGTLANPPGLVCTYTEDGKEWWFAFGRTACRLERRDGGEALRVTFSGLVEGWTVRVEVHPAT